MAVSTSSGDIQRIEKEAQDELEQVRSEIEGEMWGRPEEAPARN